MSVIVTGDLTTYPHPYLVRAYEKARQDGDVDAERAAGAEFRRRREVAAELAARKAAEQPTQPAPAKGRSRTVSLQKASDIAPRGVKWIWDARIPTGSLTLLAGREGLGKSTIAATIAAQLTRGTLPGEHEGTPRAVLVSASEDSWAHTIVPRLMAAGADLDLVLLRRTGLDILRSDVQVGIQPADLQQLSQICRRGENDQLALHGFCSLVFGNQYRETRGIHKSDLSHIEGDVADALSSQPGKLLIEQPDRGNVKFSDECHQCMCADASDFGFEEWGAYVCRVFS